MAQLLSGSAHSLEKPWRGSQLLVAVSRSGGSAAHTPLASSNSMLDMPVCPGA